MSKTYFKQFSELISQQAFDKALAFANSLVENEPKNADYIGLKAVAKFYMKEVSCMEDLNQAVGLDPANAYRYSSRAYILDALGDTEAAVNDYLKAIELDPEDPVALNNLGILEEKLGRKQHAQKRFDSSDTLLGLKKKKRQYHFPEPNLQQKIDKQKSHSKTEIISTTLSSKKGWSEFFRFIHSKFVKGGKT